MTAGDVFVVQRKTDGVWEAACCSESCAYGFHVVAETARKADADLAAAHHREELKERSAAAGSATARVAAVPAGLVPAGAMFMCGSGGCDEVARYLRCPTCGWRCVAPEAEEEAEGDQLALALTERPVHTQLDCLRIQREKPEPTRKYFRSDRARRAHEAYARIHAKHKPTRMVRRHGELTCPTCGFQP